MSVYIQRSGVDAARYSLSLRAWPAFPYAGNIIAHRRSRRIEIV